MDWSIKNWEFLPGPQKHVWRRGEWRIEVSWYWDRVEVIRTCVERIEPHPMGGGFMAREARRSYPDGISPTPQTYYMGSLHHGMAKNLPIDQANETIFAAAKEWAEHVEAQFPFKPPAPQCGQVWKWGDEGRRLVTEVNNEAVILGQKFILRSMWEEAVKNESLSLIAGPEAPWTP